MPLDISVMDMKDDLSLDQLEETPYEPITTKPRAGDNGGFDAPSDGRHGGRQHGPSPAAGDDTEPDGWPSRSFGYPIGHPAAGHAVGTGPTTGHIYAGSGRRPIPAGARYEQRSRQNRPHQDAHESLIAEPNRRLITDVRPPIKERMAVAEHEIGDLNSLYGTLYERLLDAANSADVHERFNEFDRELNRRFKNVHDRIDVLYHKRVVRDWAVSISLAVTIIYSVVLTAKHLNLL